jgi:methylmalonyl-CoA mutase cobalamin-binding subunit
LPAEEIAAAAQTHGAKAVALSIIFPGDDALLRGELAKLRQALPDTPLLIGGRVAAHYQEIIEQLGAHRMENLALLAQMLQKIAIL